MKLLLAIALTACGAPPAPVPAPAPVREADAQAAYEAKQFATCGTLYDTLATQLPAGPARTGALYNSACCFARDGKPDRAFALLDRALAAGMKDVEHTQVDEDLVSLHGDPRWQAFLAKLEANRQAWKATLGDPALREELLALVDEDQRVRNAPGQTQEAMVAIDAKTTARMKQVIAAHGWPTTRLIGADGETAAWLLVQHADADLAFQKTCLALLEQAVARGEADPQHHAYLYDRVAVAEHRPQRFGTQFLGDQPQPIEDPANVDARRKAIGLGTLAQYRDQLRAMHRK